jgi:hypothetical protein
VVQIDRVIIFIIVGKNRTIIIITKGDRETIIVCHLIVYKAIQSILQEIILICNKDIVLMKEISYHKDIIIIFRCKVTAIKCNL